MSKGAPEPEDVASRLARIALDEKRLDNEAAAGRQAFQLRLVGILCGTTLVVVSLLWIGKEHPAEFVEAVKYLATFAGGTGAGYAGRALQDRKRK